MNDHTAVSAARVCERVSAQEWAAREDLAACYRLAAYFRMTDLIYTHISARVPGPEHHFLINAFGQMWDEITASSLVKVTLDGEIVDDPMGLGINRAGYFVMPMDETLAVAAVDLGGRPHTVVSVKTTAAKVGDLQAELVHDFFEGFAIGARANVHLKVLYGRSNHHKVEAVFKAFGRALRVACARDKRMARMLPSRKGLL